METAMLSPADAMLLGQNNGFGNNGSWIWVLLLAFLWGGNGGFGWGNIKDAAYGITGAIKDCCLNCVAA